jgi:hypothetical protein
MGRNNAVAFMTTAFLLAFGAAAWSPAYTGEVVGVSLAGGGGTSIRVKICWTESEVAPTASNTSARGWEMDSPPLDPDDDLGRDESGTPVGSQQSGGSGIVCQSFDFIVPSRDCESGDEEYSATVTVAGQNFAANGPGGAPFSFNLC